MNCQLDKMIGDIDDFSFYLRLTKPLVLNLPNAKDRTTAALWIKKLCNVNATGPENNLHIEYLKLLLFVMQRNALSGIFEKPPLEGPLKPFPKRHTATDMMSLVKPTKAKPPLYPPIFTSIGGDLCQFVAIQEIPYFGLHGYYAISTEPLSKWTRVGISSYKKSMERPKTNLDCFKDNYNKLSNMTHNYKNDLVNAGEQIISSTPPKEVGRDTAEINGMEEAIHHHQGRSSYQHLHQVQRQEISRVETRPCWGRNRYIERFIDESPHLVADLDLSQADALLHVFSDKKLNISETGTFGGPCISSKRREIERMMNLQPCVMDSEDQVSQNNSTSDTEKSETTKLLLNSNLKRRSSPYGIKMQKQ